MHNFRIGPGAYNESLVKEYLVSLYILLKISTKSVTIEIKFKLYFELAN